MRPRYYVHMGPKSPDAMSSLWKTMHIIIFLLIIVSSLVATWAVFEILDMYKFHCIIYAKVEFELPRKPDCQEIVSLQTDHDWLRSTVEKKAQLDSNATDCITKTTADLPKTSTEASKEESLFSYDWTKRYKNRTITKIDDIDNEGFLNLRKTVFATIVMCDLMLFTPLASSIIATVLAALLGLGAKGGAGNPGDLLPNPWICVYPFLGISGFMVIFYIITNNLFHSGLNTFCSRYESLTDEYFCTPKMDKYTLQFNHEAKPFYYWFILGSISVKITSGLWILQVVVYILRILCIADFSLYLTRIKVRGKSTDDEKLIGLSEMTDPRMANVVLKMVQQQQKQKNF